MATEMTALDRFLGTKIRFFRSRMNWPLKSLATELGISIQQLQRYELGVNKVSASTLYELAIIFDISTQAFFDGYLPHADQETTKPSAFNVLLIEDNPHDEFLMRKALTDFSESICIYTLREGEAALDFFRHLNRNEASSLPKPDIILLDLYLPGMKGLDILKDIKRKPLLQDIPVIVMTTSLSPEDIASTYHLQASGFIRKSFSYDSFKEQVHKTFAYWTQTVSLPT